LLVNTLLLVVTFLFAYSCTFPMQSHESQVTAIVAQLGGNHPCSYVSTYHL
jgi:hypothetical protein